MEENDFYKVYVETGATFSPDGFLRPAWIRWTDGRIYSVDRLKRVDRAASLKAGGSGIRYTVMIEGRELYLFYEENYRWFIDAEDCFRL